MLDEDATRMLATCPQQVVRVVRVEYGERHDTRTNGQHYTPQQTAGRPIRYAYARDKLNGEVARYPRRILARILRMSGVLARMLRENCSLGI